MGKLVVQAMDAGVEWLHCRIDRIRRDALTWHFAVTDCLGRQTSGFCFPHWDWNEAMAMSSTQVQLLISLSHVCHLCLKWTKCSTWQNEKTFMVSKWQESLKKISEFSVNLCLFSGKTDCWQVVSVSSWLTCKSSPSWFSFIFRQTEKECIIYSRDLLDQIQTKAELHTLIQTWEQSKIKALLLNCW